MNFGDLDRMIDYLQWPDEFTNPTPMLTFGYEFITFLEEQASACATITANKYWSSFVIQRGDRIIDFIQRGKLGRGRSECWEVRLAFNGHRVVLGRLFGIRDYACVVTSGIDNIRTITNMWLDGADVESIIAVVQFWDKMNTLNELMLPSTTDTELDH